LDKSHWTGTPHIAHNTTPLCYVGNTTNSKAIIVNKALYRENRKEYPTVLQLTSPPKKWISTLYNASPPQWFLMWEIPQIVK